MISKLEPLTPLWNSYIFDAQMHQSACHSLCRIRLAVHHKYTFGLVRDCCDEIEQLALVRMGAVAINLLHPGPYLVLLAIYARNLVSLQELSAQSIFRLIAYEENCGLGIADIAAQVMQHSSALHTYPKR